MRSKSKSVLRTALIYIGIFICGAVLVVLLLSFFDNTLNGTLREWFYRGYMTEYYDSEMATDYVEPDWNAIKGLAFRLALAVFAFCGAYRPRGRSSRGQIDPEKGKPYDSNRFRGIGLSACQAIVSAHGGKISASNRPEGGAVFDFSLPAEEEEE